jgi:hypothetical protein
MRRRLMSTNPTTTTTNRGRTRPSSCTPSSDEQAPASATNGRRASGRPRLLHDRASATHRQGTTYASLRASCFPCRPSPPCRSKQFPPAVLALLPCFLHACRDHLCPYRHLPPFPPPTAKQRSIPLLPMHMHDAPAIVAGGCGTGAYCNMWRIMIYF